jgi:hypothetical protein
MARGASLSLDAGADWTCEPGHTGRHPAAYHGPGPSKAHVRARSGGYLLWLGVAACAGEDATAPASTHPRIVAAAAAASPLSSLVSFIDIDAREATLARVLYSAEGEAPVSTPRVRVLGDRARIAVLGLRAGAAYRAVAEVVGPGGRTQSDTIGFSAGPLPALLQRVSIVTTGSGGPGLTLTALPIGGTALFAFAFDSAGSIRWYRQFDDPRTGGELKQQANGNFTVYIGASFGSQPVPGYFVEFTPTGDSVRAFTAPAPLYTDNHELWITGSGSEERIHLFGYDHRTTDLSALGGAADAPLAGHSLLRLRPDGSPEFAWSAWDHLAISDWIEPPIPGPVDPLQPDFAHPNAIAFDRDGDYIVSWRNLGEITKLDPGTGTIRWRLGGNNNEFAFVGDPLGGFSAQHSPKVLPDGNLLIYDNGTRHVPAESRAVEYALDTIARTATMIWEYRHVPAIYTPFVGSVQRLENERTLIGWGTVGRATEAASDGGTTWEAEIRLDGVPAFVYRVVRIASLYRYEVP